MNKDKHSAPVLELPLPEDGSHGRGTRTGVYYQIEFRTSSSQPVVIGDGREPFPFVIDNYWRQLPVTRGMTKWGVNIPIKSWDGEAADHGLLSYSAAEAHRWAFIAALDAGAGGPGGSLCVETRLVAIEFHKEYRLQEKGVTSAQGNTWKPPDLAPRKSSVAENAD